MQAVDRVDRKGSRRHTQVLLLLTMLEESYVAELARLLRVRRNTILGIADGLERKGLIGGRLVGRQRMYRLEPHYVAHRELRALLLKLAEGESELLEALAELRRRPRRRGKPLIEEKL